MIQEKKYQGYGYHGGGRKATGIKRVSISISGQPEEIEQLKKMLHLQEKPYLNLFWIHLLKIVPLQKKIVNLVHSKDV